MADIPITTARSDIPLPDIKDPAAAQAIRSLYADLSTAVNNLSALVTALLTALLADGSVVGATSKAQKFTNGVQLSSISAIADSTSAIAFCKQNGTALMYVDTVNGRLGLGRVPAYKLDVYGTTRLGAIVFSGTNSTGAGSAALGANSPATVPGAPYTWIQAVSADNTTVWFPAWK